MPEHGLGRFRGPAKSWGTSGTEVPPSPHAPQPLHASCQRWQLLQGAEEEAPGRTPGPQRGSRANPRPPPRRPESRLLDTPPPPNDGSPAAPPPDGRSAPRLPSARQRTGGVAEGRAGPGPGGCASYLGQRPRAQPAAARPAAPGAAGAPRGGAAGAFLLSRRRRRRLPGRAQNIHGLCPGSRPPRPGRSPRRMPGASAKFFVPLTCSLAPPGRLWTPYARSLLQPSGCSLASAGRSVPSCGCRASGKASPPSSDSEKSAPCDRGLPSRGSLGGGCCGSSRSARSLSGSQLPSTCHFPPTLQPSAPAGPMADAGPGRRPSALCCRL